MKTRGLFLAASIAISMPAAAGAQQFEATMTNLALSLERAVSGLRIDTRQQSLGAEQVGNAATASNMALSNVVVETEQQVALREAVNRYESMQNDVTGLCAAVASQRQAGRAQTVNRDLGQVMDDHERNWMAVGGDRATALAQTQRMRRSAFCTESERAAGLCLPEADNSMGGMPAADSSADSWLLRREYGSAELGYGSVYIDTVAPFPSISTAEDARTSVQGLVERASARRQLALVAISRAGLSDVLLRGLEGGLDP